VLDEIARVLKPGGLFLFDTINRTMLAAFMIVHIGESVLRLLLRGTHDPAKFIKPSELSANGPRMHAGGEVARPSNGPVCCGARWLSSVPMATESAARMRLLPGWSRTVKRKKVGATRFERATSTSRT